MFRKTICVSFFYQTHICLSNLIYKLKGEHIVLFYLKRMRFGDTYVAGTANFFPILTFCVGYVLFIRFLCNAL